MFSKVPKLRQWMYNKFSEVIMLVIRTLTIAKRLGSVMIITDRNEDLKKLIKDVTGAFPEEWLMKQPRPLTRLGRVWKMLLKDDQDVKVDQRDKRDDKDNCFLSDFKAVRDFRDDEDTVKITLIGHSDENWRFLQEAIKFNDEHQVLRGNEHKLDIQAQRAYLKAEEAGTYDESFEAWQAKLEDLNSRFPDIVSGKITGPIIIGQGAQGAQVD